MTAETALFMEKLDNLSGIWETFRSNVTISEDIKQTAEKVAKKGRILLATVKKEGTLNAGGKFEWVDSILIKCLQNGHWLLIDNANLCSPAVLDRLNALLEPNGTLAISEKGVNENGDMVEIRPHKDFRLFLTMNPKNGEISRAMRNRGVEIFLTNDYRSAENFDIKSLINIEGIVDNNIIELLINVHSFIADLIIVDKPNIESILQAAFLISQQIKRGVELDEAVTNTIVDIYYKPRSDNDFNSNDPLSVIKNEIQRHLNEKISRVIDIYDPRITLKSTELNSNIDFAKIKQQFVGIRKYFQATPENYTIIYYFMMHLYSISSPDDIDLCYFYLNRIIANENYPILYKQVNEIFYKIFLEIQRKNETLHLPMDRKWLPDTIYKNINTFLGNRLLLAIYYSIHSYLNDCRITAGSDKEKYSLMKYSADVKAGKIQDRINDVVIREASTLIEKCDKFFDIVLKNENIALTNEQVIEVMSLFQWRVNFVNQLLTTYCGRKEKVLQLKEIVSNLHVYYKWFVKNCINKVLSLVKIQQKPDIVKMVSVINSELVNCFDNLKKLGRQFQKMTLKPPPLTNGAQLTVIPEYHKMIEVFNLAKDANISKVLLKMSDKDFATFLINLKVNLNYGMEEIPGNYRQFKEIVEKFHREVDKMEYQKSDVNYLLITNYLSIITIYQQRLNNMENILNVASVPCVLQGVIKQYQTTKDERLAHEITSQTTHYLLNNPSTMPWKYIKYKSNREDIKELTLSWQNPTLTYLLNSILVNPSSKTFGMRVDLKDYHQSMNLYNKLNHLLWKNSHQLADMNCDFIYLETKYIIKKLDTFIQSLGTSLGIDTCNRSIPELIKLCIDEIKLVQTSLEDELTVWYYFLSQCHEQLLQLNCTSQTTNTNAIANCYITISYLNALLNSKLPPIDPYKKIILKKNHIANEIANFETLDTSFKIQSEIYSNVEYPLCPIIKQRIQFLREQVIKLSEETAMRPHFPEYQSLLMDINHAFQTILSPKKINVLFKNLDQILSEPETNSMNYDAIKQATLTVTSIENFIHVLNQYRYFYPDIIEPLYCNIMELTYGIKMKITYVERMIWQRKFAMLYGIDIQNKITNFVKFPTLNENQCSIQEAIDNYMDKPMQDLIASCSFAEQIPSQEHDIKFSLLKCAIQDTFNSCTINAKYSQAPNIILFDKFNKFIKQFVTAWDKQEKERQAKETEKESLYKVKTKCDDKPEDEQIEEEFINLFPSYFTEFFDMETPELKDDLPTAPQSQAESLITLDDINLVYNLHAAYLYSHSKSPWLNLNEKHNYVDHVTQLSQKFKLLKLMLDSNICTALNYKMDSNILGSLHVLINIAQRYGSTKLLDDTGSPTRTVTKKSLNFYRDSNIDEIKPCYQILQELHHKIQELLSEWPEHPTLQNISVLIERICNFDIASPISKFLTGFDILLNKCHEWEENAHSGVSIQTHILNITAQIITWRKLELNMWRDILNITFNRLNEPIGKWWCYMYEIIEQFEEDAITTSDLITTLIKFITESNLAEFENRLELLFLFHCHCLHVRSSKKSTTLINILWNIYHHYKHFLSVILLKIKEFRTPIEKKLKEYVKIVTWKDVNYWSIKETLHKTHKTIHKHIREFEVKLFLRQSVYPFLCDNSEQDTVYENVGIWDRPQRVSPKTYHYTMDCLSYIARKGSPKKLSETGDKVPAIKTEKHFKKSLTLCKQVISAAQYPKLVKSLDTVIGEIIETSNYLQKLEVSVKYQYVYFIIIGTMLFCFVWLITLKLLKVDTTLPKDKQKMQAKNILQQKQRSLADLYKLLIKMGVSFKKGILESKLNKPETRFTTKPINLEALFDHLNKQRNDEKILTMWDGCELYYLRSTIRLNSLEEALQRPSKDLGPQNIERCKGFSNDLVVLLHEQKQKLITSSETFYYLRYYLNYFIDFCNETQFIHKDIFEDLRSSMCNLATIMEHFKIILQTCPEEAHDETILNTVPVLQADKLNVLCWKYDENWNKANGLLNSAMTSIEKVLILLKKNKNIIPSSKNSFIAPLYIPMTDFDGILEELEYLKLKISNLLDLLGDIPLYNSLKWALNTIDDIRNKLIVSKPTILNMDKYAENVAKNSEILLKKFLIAFQNLYKKYKTPTEIELTEKNVASEEIDSTIYDEHLTNIITTSLFNDLSSLNTIEILGCIEKIVENINKIDPTHYSKITNNINQNLQLLERFVLFFEYFITQQVSSYRVTSKLTSILLNIFIELAKKGFCIPPEFSDELSGEGEKQQSGGMGLGDGEGEKDVSDRIESEDQLDDAKQEGQTQQEKENKDCKEEDNAIEMSDDFDSKLQDGDKDRDNEDEESQSDAEEQMGDTEKGADQIDEQIWGSDEEEEDTDEGYTNKSITDKDIEEKGNKGEKESEQKIGAKENQSAENEESPDVQDEPKDKQSTNPINEQDPEYDDDQVDPYHGNQPELPEPEPMDLPDNLELDEENEKADEENQEENPFDVDTMKEEINEDNAPENIENIEPENEPTPDNLENIDKSETSTLDQKDTNENQVQPMDIDNNINESADKVNVNQTKHQTSSENDPINQEDMPDKEGVGQSQMEESSTGHKGAANAQQETSDSQQETHERSRRPGESDSKRSLGDASEPVQKRLKTIHTDDSVEENETKESNAEMYQHIKEAQDHTEQVLDVATKEQVEQQKEIPIMNEEETEKPTESSEDLPEQHEENLDMKSEIKQKAERLESDKKDMTDKVEHPEGKLFNNDFYFKTIEYLRKSSDIVKNANMEVEVEGELIQTSVVPRGDQSSHHTQLFNIIESTKLTAEDMISIRAQIEEQLANWSETPSSEEAQRTWEKISSLTSSLAQHLSEQLRLVLEPTQASRLRGDFKTGKRINMRKIIPYIASQFRKDKIWLRRTKPAKRQYQIVLAIDDSSSMDDNHSKELAFESVALISKALTLLESGQLSILSFGETTELLHKLEEPFTDKNGHKLLQKFNFEQRKTCVGQMVNFATEMLNTAHFQTNALNAKLLVIVSDGRGIFSEGETYIKQAIRRANLANIFMVFIIIDNPVNNSSILDIKMPVFNKIAGDLITINNYMDSFPFPFYIILRDINSLPNVLSDALRQWFEMVSNKDR
ncbi:midasin-related [Holotrichia oblita]|uniref:Midasin-related n=1 Tax=Holotrichia oblita TaxID=644536 RepID=A0ACB9TF07_HOLOL|nr:midasin-related [Holotrichia oblita]